MKTSLLLLNCFLALTTITNTAASNSFQKNEISVPLIDLSSSNDEKLASEIAHACSTIGFFQVINHGIPQELMDRFLLECTRYFDLDQETKQKYKRHTSNSRGWFNDEYTKQKRDWKECLDVGVPGSRDWNIEDDSDLNACLDGWNQLPTEEELSRFRETIVEYFEACSRLSDRIASLMALGMGKPKDDPFIQALKEEHSSYLRLNHYPPCEPSQLTTDNKPLGISPHRDAGFLTVLIQDDNCHSLQACLNDEWVSVHPTPGAFTINTGDMAQIWSNGKYRAPLHRVLTNPLKRRYSAPFFYNPGYKTFVEPVNSPENYHPLLWGYFRAVRFAGDLTDLGVEIQVDHFDKNNPSACHLARQEAFYKGGWTDVPFNVDRYRELIQQFPDESE